MLPSSVVVLLIKGARRINKGWSKWSAEMGMHKGGWGPLCVKHGDLQGIGHFVLLSHQVTNRGLVVASVGTMVWLRLGQKSTVVFSIAAKPTALNIEAERPQPLVSPVYMQTLQWCTLSDAVQFPNSSFLQDFYDSSSWVSVDLIPLCLLLFPLFSFP